MLNLIFHRLRPRFGVVRDTILYTSRVFRKSFPNLLLTSLAYFASGLLVRFEYYVLRLA